MKYILRKLLTLIITLFIVSLLAFLAFQVIPGSPVDCTVNPPRILREGAVTEADIRAAR